jgi:hypothetical protein
MAGWLRLTPRRRSGQASLPEDRLEHEQQIQIEGSSFKQFPSAMVAHSHGAFDCEIYAFETYLSRAKFALSDCPTLS